MDKLFKGIVRPKMAECFTAGHNFQTTIFHTMKVNYWPFMLQTEQIHVL